MRGAGIRLCDSGDGHSTKVRAQARDAVYQESQIPPVPPRLRRKYLWRSRNSSEGLLRVVPELRRKVTFHPLNFMDEDFRIRDIFDAIFFRNVIDRL